MTYTVNVAEDEELLLTNLVQKIQKADPDFLVAGTAQTGDQALALVEKLSPDLVITDIRMPVMDCAIGRFFFAEKTATGQSV